MSIALLDPSDSSYKAALRRLKKSQKASPQVSSATWTPFRAAEKQFMQKYPPPDLSAVLDLAAGDPSRICELADNRWVGNPAAFPITGLRGANAFVVDAVPGAPGHRRFIAPRC